MRVKKLIDKINRYNYSYYTLDNPIVSDKEYDREYDRLVQMEKETGVIYSNSPTQIVGYELKKELEKNTLQYPLKSLDKTKDIELLKEFMGSRECVVMLKCDGLTNELNYINNKLTTATTRGNGEVGERVEHNAIHYQNIPLQIELEDIIAIGEAIIYKNDFEEINRKLPPEEKFSTPRNLASGSIRQLNSEISKQRRVNFLGFGINGKDNRYKTKLKELMVLQDIGFEVAPYMKCNRNTIEECIEKIKLIAEERKIPYDGMVVQYNNLSLKESLGSTSKFPKWAKAFKFKDEEVETTLIGIEYNASRNGVLTLVAIFEPVELDGTEVEKASLHNLSTMEELKLGVGDKLVVYKANQIIPQVARNNTESNTLKPIETCPYCKAPTAIRGNFLYCSNNNCTCRMVNKIAHFCSRDAMNILGFSEKTIEKLINNGFLTNIESIYSLESHKSKLYCLEGMGKTSVDKLLKGIENSKAVDDYNFLYALGIPQIGLSTAKTICKAIDIRNILTMELNDFRKIDGLGDVASQKLYEFICEENEVLYNFLHLLNFKERKAVEVGESLSEKSFVITGSINHFKNRNELKTKIESLGGKVSGAVTKKTDYLINNDKDSITSKNTTAKTLGVQIISEEEFLNLL